MSELSTPRPSGRGMAVLTLASAGCALTVLDTNVVGIVLPAIAKDLHASFAEIEWVVSAYVLVFAALLLPAGVIADKHGRRRAFFAGITIFGLTSAACGMAHTPMALALARAAQGVGAAFLIAPALAVIGNRFQDERARANAWAIWGTVMGMTMVLSPIIGGLITTAFGWRWAFYINLPICAVLLLAVPSLVEESRDPHPRELDLPGMVLFVAGMFGMTSALILGARDGWTSTKVAACWVLGACMFGLFVGVEKRSRHPMLDLSLFRKQPFIGAVTAMFAYAASAQVMASLLPLYLQGAMAHRPIAAGIAMLPFALAMLIFPRVGRWLGTLVESYHVLTLGLLAVGFGNVLMVHAAMDGSHSQTALAIAMATLGAGGGLLNGETQKAVMTNVSSQRAGMASGISTTSRFAGILLGFSGLGALLASSTRGALLADKTLQALPGFQLTNSLVDQVAAGDFHLEAVGAQQSQMAELIAQARLDYSHAFADVFLLAGVVAGIAANIVFWTMRPKRSSSTP